MSVCVIWSGSTKAMSSDFAVPHMPHCPNLLRLFFNAGPAAAAQSPPSRFATLRWPTFVANLPLIFASYFAFSFIGRHEGIHFHRSKWILFIFLATLVGTCSTLYDKWLIQHQGYTAVQVQVWYILYLMLIFTFYFGALWWPQRKRSTPFTWRWTIPLIGILLFIADFVYFFALTDPAALIIILSILRRCSVLVSFFAGAFLFKEVNKRKKAWVLTGILAGVLLIVLSGG